MEQTQPEGFLLPRSLAHPAGNPAVKDPAAHTGTRGISFPPTDRHGRVWEGSLRDPGLPPGRPPSVPDAGVARLRLRGVQRALQKGVRSSGAGREPHCSDGRQLKPRPGEYFLPLSFAPVRYSNSRPT